MWWLLPAIYALGIIPTGALFLRTGLYGAVNDAGEAVLLAFFWPLVLFVAVPVVWAGWAILSAVETLSRVHR